MSTIHVAKPNDPGTVIEVNEFNLEWYRAQGYEQSDPDGKIAAAPKPAAGGKE